MLRVTAVTCGTWPVLGSNQRSLSGRLAGAQSAQIWAASVLVGIGPATPQSGGYARAYQGLTRGGT